MFIFAPSRYITITTVYSLMPEVQARFENFTTFIIHISPLVCLTRKTKSTCRRKNFILNEYVLRQRSIIELRMKMHAIHAF